MTEWLKCKVAVLCSAHVLTPFFVCVIPTFLFCPAHHFFPSLYLCSFLTLVIVPIKPPPLSSCLVNMALDNVPFCCFYRKHVQFKFAAFFCHPGYSNDNPQRKGSPCAWESTDIIRSPWTPTVWMFSSTTSCFPTRNPARDSGFCSGALNSPL